MRRDELVCVSGIQLSHEYLSILGSTQVKQMAGLFLQIRNMGVGFLNRFIIEQTSRSLQASY